MDQGCGERSLLDAVAGREVGADVKIHFGAKRYGTAFAARHVDDLEAAVRIEYDRLTVRCEAVAGQCVAAGRAPVFLRIRLHGIGQPAVVAADEVADAQSRLAVVAGAVDELLTVG